MKKILKITGIVILLSMVPLIVIPWVITNGMTESHIDFNKEWTGTEYGLQANHFFTYTADSVKISAYEVEVENPKAVVMCISGIHGPSATIYFGHAKLFRENGYATVMLDMRAHGKSEGNKIFVGYKEYLDVNAIVDHLKKDDRYKDLPLVVMGVSMGAAVAINAIGENEHIDGLISLSAYSSWEDNFLDNMALQAPRWLSTLECPFVHLVSFFKYGKKSLSVKPVKEIEKLGDRPALLIHSKEDSQVPVSNFHRLLRKAPSQVETFLTEGDKHFITENFQTPWKDAEYSALLLGFLNTHFGNTLLDHPAPLAGE